MSRNQKIVLGVVIAVIILCLVGAIVGSFLFKKAGDVIGEAIISDPQEAENLGRTMLDYTLPPGYAESAGMDVMVMQMVFITTSPQSDDDLFIMLTGVPADSAIDVEEMRKQIQTYSAQSSNAGKVNMQVVDQQTMTIRGQEVELTLYEGTDEKGNKMKQVMSDLFEGKNGNNVIILIVGAADTWDQAEVDAFISSIK